MSWHGETGSALLDIRTSCSATSCHGETTAYVKLFFFEQQDCNGFVDIQDVFHHPFIFV